MGLLSLLGPVGVAADLLTQPEVGPQAARDADQDGLGNSALLGMFGFGEKPKKLEKFGPDVMSAVDQSVARLELADKFAVGDAEAGEGQAKVSKEEFDKIVALYSDIRLGKTNLSLDTSGMSEEEAEAFKKGTMGDMAKMLQTESGRALLEGLAHNEKGIKTSVGRNFENEGPVTTGYLERDRDCTESFKKDRMGDEVGWCIDDRAHDGKGVDSEVRYRPGETTHTEHDGDVRSDVTLYHELTHAWHNMQGDQARGRTPVPHDANESVDRDEFQATGLGPWAEAPYSENRYRNERHALGDDMGPRETYSGAKP